MRYNHGVNAVYSAELTSSELDEASARFCREEVFEPWRELIRFQRGERAGGWIKPFLGYGPKLPLWWVGPLSPIAVRLAIGSRANLLTLVLSRARNRVVFASVERAVGGRYIDMKRLDRTLAAESIERALRLVQAGAEDEALALVGALLAGRGEPELAPDVLKVADLSFFDAFAELAELQRAGRTREWVRKSGEVARRVLRERLLYFYPEVPLERLLAAGRRMA